MRRSSVISLVLGVWLTATPTTALGLTVDLQLDTITVDTPADELSLTGTLTCDAGATVTIGFAVTQGPAFVNGFHTFECTGTEQTWEIQETLGEPPVHPGPAMLDFGFTAELGEESIASGRNLEVFIAPAGAVGLMAVS